METIDFTSLREQMVITQLIGRGIRDKRVLEAMRKVPRHLFIEETRRQNAYNDCAVKIGEDQTISQPYMVAVMTEMLALRGDEKVLEIGTGSGYQSAILAELAREVFTIERFQTLSDSASGVLNSLGYTNIHLLVSDGTLGWPGISRFNRIVITAGAPEIPANLIGDLEDNGIILAPVGSEHSQILVKLLSKGGAIFKEQSTPCVFVPLVGTHGWHS